MVGIILAIVLTLSAAAGGIAYASQDSMPGDTFYPVKLGIEQMRVMLPGSEVVKVERTLRFAERRIEEMQALAENERSQYMGMSVEGYDSALNITLTRLDWAQNRGLAIGNLTALVANATAKHLCVFDSVYDMVPPTAREAIAHAMNVSETGYFHALVALSKNNTVRVAEMNLAAMEGRLNRVRTRSQNAEVVQIALQQFEAMADFNEQISQIAQGRILNMTEVEDLIAAATLKHLEMLADVWEKVPGQAQPAIERVMANLMICQQNRVEALEQKGAKAPPSPQIPEKIRIRVQQRIQEQEQQWPDGTIPSWQEVPAEAGQQNSHSLG